jgi:putative MATE family efflux protein
MYAMVFSSILNIILDPFLIYTCNMGIAGAAWGTIISISCVCVLYAYWIFIKCDTYVAITKTAFTYQKAIVFDILKVGLPASVEFITMAVMALFINWVLIITDGADAVAIFTGGWRVVTIAIVPLVAIGTAVTAVAGARFGARKFAELKEALLYGSKLSVAIALEIALITFIFDHSISYLFAYSEGGEHILSSMSDFLRVMVLIYPFAAIGIAASCLFQGVGKGLTALAINVMRSLLLICVFSYILGIVFDFKSIGVWWGVVLGDMLGGIIGFCIALLFTSTLLKNNSMGENVEKEN